MSLINNDRRLRDRSPSSQLSSQLSVLTSYGVYGVLCKFASRLRNIHRTWVVMKGARTPYKKLYSTANQMLPWPFVGYVPTILRTA